jgi:RND family efflux transporter MFP subunit
MQSLDTVRRMKSGPGGWGALVILSIIVLLAGCGSASTPHADNGPSTATPVAVAEVGRHNLASQLEIASEFLPYQEINVYAKVSGYVQKLYVDWGTHVKQGQLLADLEIPELEQQLQLDEATVRRNESDLQRAREELSRAESNYKVTHLTYTRLADVQKSQPGLVAQQDIDVTQGKDLEASAGVSAAKDSLAASQQALVAAKAALGKDKAMYGYAQITAPFDGVVTELDAYTGALLPAGTSSNKGDQALCRLSQNDPLRLVIPVPASAVPDIRIGSPVEVRVPILNKTIRGRVARFADQIDLSTRTMHTEIDIPNPTLELVPGTYAEALITLNQRQNALAVPIQAIVRTGDRATVFIVDNAHKVQVRDVQLGIQTANEAEILSGVTEGERVVIGNQSQLRPGQVVQPTVTSETPASGGM